MLNAHDVLRESVKNKMHRHIDLEIARDAYIQSRKTRILEYIIQAFQEKLKFVNESIENASKIGEFSVEQPFASFDDSDAAVAGMVIITLREKGFDVEIHPTTFNSGTVDAPIDTPFLKTIISW
jgi:single-stranded DNA-specific DHH superfamily exonuclease